MAELIIGIDLGGTNLRCALMDDEHRILARYETSTGALDGPDNVVQRMASGVLAVTKQAGVATEKIRAVGIGAPGPLDSCRGVVLEMPNLPGWEDYPLAARLSEKTNLTCLLENDANAAGWGEFWGGAGQGCSSMILMTLGTGIGGAVIMHNELVRGPDTTAGEIGHLVVTDGGRLCGCGGHGCIEAYASATATVARFVEALTQGWDSSLASKPHAEITCADIFTAAAAGDHLATQIAKETGRYLGVMAANMANLLNPERCVFSGGMIKAGDLLFDAIREGCAEHAFPAPAKRMEILPAALGGDAGVIGAAGLALQRVLS